MDELIGASVAMHCVRAAIDRLAGSQTPLVLTGETGTGKSRLARLMASVTSRADAPFICIDGAALDDGLMPADMRIAWMAAEGGTLFIDHVGETPTVLQQHLAALLICNRKDGRAKPGGRGERASIGSQARKGCAGARTASRPRLIAASQKRLEGAVAKGTFDGALYSCMHGAAIHLPALRYRLEDIPALAKHFFMLYQPQGRRYELSLPAIGRLQGYEWPGNVRELNNVLHRSIVLAGARTRVQPCDIVFDGRGFAAQSATLRLAPTR